MSEESPEEMSGLRIVVIGLVASVAVAVSIGYLSNPSLSPIATLRDSDGDGVPNAEDFWDSGNGGLIVRVEVFELISGFCDFFSNCEPSFRLRVDIDQDGVVDVARRADFEDFLDTQPLINPVSWSFDVPEDVQEIDLSLFVFELDVFSGDDVIDIHPDPESIAGWVTVDFPYLYVRFVTQGDSGAVGRLTYSVEAIEA